MSNFARVTSVAVLAFGVTILATNADAAVQRGRAVGITSSGNGTGNTVHPTIFGNGGATGGNGGTIVGRRR